MENLPSIEFFMPFFGDVNHFYKAVESVLTQTEHNWKLTIIDDCYPDTAPQEFIKSLGDSRIRYIRNVQNLGIAVNFQSCINLAQSPYITIMGCDDLLMPDYLAHLNSLIVRYPDCAYFQPGVSVVDQHGNKFLPLNDRVKHYLRSSWGNGQFAGENITSSLLKGNWTYFPSICWKTEMLQKFGFNSDYQIVLDLDLQLNILFSGESLCLDNKKVFQYRRHSKSASMLTSSNGLRFLEEKQLFSDSEDKANKLGWIRAKRAARLHLTSRMNALMECIYSLLHFKFGNSKKLIKHIMS